MNIRVEEYLRELLERAFLEDIGDGDHSSLACIPPEQKGRAKLLFKQSGIFAGAEITRFIVREVHPGLEIHEVPEDGTDVEPGMTGFYLYGPVLKILSLERTLLNILQRMSGIATRTRQYVQALEGLKTKVLDTRKTAPGLRLLEKEAVRIGGGINHRMGLYDMIMLKDNHIDFAGGIEAAIDRVHEYLEKKGKDLKIEIEARSLDDVHKILDHGGADRIMLDNFDILETEKAVKLINGKMETESSGGITLKNIRAYALRGVDYVSVGDLTHHVMSLDMSLKAVQG